MIVFLQIQWRHSHCDITLMCDKCDNLCEGKDYLQRHMMNKHEDKKIICDKCSFVFALANPCDDTIMIRKHQAEPIFLCRYCHKALIDKTYFHGHMNSPMDSQPRKCPKCEQKSLVTNLHC